MGFFGLFGKRDPASIIRKHRERVANRRAQAPDRWDSIQALSEVSTAEAVEALLPRFTFYVDPSITDQDEKDAAFEAIVAVGEPAVEPVRAFLRKTDSISWGLKVFDRILPPDAVVSELVALLQQMDTEYERDPQKKLQLLSTLEDRRDPSIAKAVERFVDDVNETARFHAVGAILSQDNAQDFRESLREAFAKEESVRVRVRILEGFAERAWELGQATESLRSRLTEGFSLDRKGIPKRN